MIATTVVVTRSQQGMLTPNWCANWWIECSVVSG